MLLAPFAADRGSSRDEPIPTFRNCFSPRFMRPKQATPAGAINTDRRLTCKPQSSWSSQAVSNVDVYPESAKKPATLPSPEATF
ncbi:hypothetical protein, partial [Polyangium fumosum]|uniref:hypothetical protein n=1 Tax=Polyangium fumosum TaxID=889272 RepID=UPI001B861F6E